MLAPDTRELLLDLLRPPEGWQVDLAVGTSYTLDLQALLVAPLSFAMFDWALDDDGRVDPLAALEALRRYAERTTVFCQAGMIGLPSHYQPLLVHLERSVVPVTPPNAHAIFHPKVWVLRFYAEGQDPRYRALVLSRNLTFDTSWDTVVALESRRRLPSHQPSAPLAEFLRACIQRAGNHLEPARAGALTELANEIAHVRFDPPEGFDDVRFHPTGFNDRGLDLPASRDRTLVVSPFLGSSALPRLRSSGTEADVLVSRPEELDACGANALSGWDTRVLDTERLEHDTLGEPHGLDRGGAAGTTSESSIKRESAVGELRGLHAKLVLIDRGDRSHLFTGSANATAAAYGDNVEMMVELRGAREDVGIDRILTSERGNTSFVDLLRPYPVTDEPQDPEATETALASALDQARRALGRLDFTATAEAASPGDDEGADDTQSYVLTLAGSGDLKLHDAVSNVQCWRITAGQGHQVAPEVDSHGLQAQFGRVSEDGLSAFFAFEVTAAVDDQRDSVRFVIAARLEGGPADRADRVLSRLLRDRHDLLRYLQFLLADGSHGLLALLEGIGTPGERPSNERGFDFQEPALLERLLETLANDPARLSHVERLFDTLRRTGRVDELAPPGLADVWAVIDTVRRELLDTEPDDAEVPA